MRPSTFLERIEIKAPEGTREAVCEAANREGQTLSEFIRAAVRDQLRRTDQMVAAHAAGD